MDNAQLQALRAKSEKRRNTKQLKSDTLVQRCFKFLDSNEKVIDVVDEFVTYGKTTTQLAASFQRAIKATESLDGIIDAGATGDSVWLYTLTDPVDESDDDEEIDQ